MQDKTQLSYLGVVPCCHITYRSSDRRWHILYDLRDESKPSTLLVDLQSGRIVLREDRVFELVGFTDGGAYLDGLFFYSYADSKAFSLEEGLYPGLIVDILPGGIAIGAFTKDMIGADKYGIYVASNETGRKLLIKGAEPLFG